MSFYAWLEANWFTLLQSMGIVGGFVFTALSLRLDAKVRRLSNLFDLTHSHRAIWSELYRRPELIRVTDPSPNLHAREITPAEELFVRLLILHLGNAYRAIQAGLYSAPEGLRRDVREFFAQPIPRIVWQRLRPLQNRDFARFVEDCFKEER